MSEKDWRAPTVATFYANETDINELTLISPGSATQVSERSFRPPAAEPPDREDRPCPVTIESPSKVSQVLVDTSEQTIVRWNITRFRSLLVSESDSERRRLVSKLLAEEQAKLLRSVLRGSLPARRSTSKGS